MTPGAGGTMTPGTGGSMNPGAGGTMAPGAGGTMTPGAGGTMTPGSGGTGGIQTTDCSTLPCGSMCIGHDHPMGPPVEFFSGYCGDDAECHREAVECAPPQACMTTEECLLLPFLPECTMCADGEVACAKLDCVMGECAVIPPSCRSTQCENVECGTACACPDGQMCPDGAMIFATCNADGQCQAGQAECGGTCMTSMDCPQLLICAECGNGFCATNLCYGGRCEMVCPMPTADTCETSMDCPPPPPSCEMCPNGSCAGTSCIEGTCVFGCESE